MIYGTFDSKTGVYGFEYGGKWAYYKAHFYANSITNSDVVSIYNICIQGVDTMQKGFPNAVFVTWKDRWEKAIKPHYEGLYAQSHLHYYDASIAAGKVPTWALAWEQSAYLLIHEYAPGKIVWMRPEDKFANDVLMFFYPADKPKPPAVTPPTTTPTDPGVIPGIPSNIRIDLHVYHHDNAGEE